MIGKIMAAMIVIPALAIGLGVYYLQVYAYYDEVQVSGQDDVVLTLLATGQPEAILYDTFSAIDSTSSPIRYRACFTTQMSLALLTETYQIHDAPDPRIAPGWFDCFDAAEIGAALDEGGAVAFLGIANVEYGIDRIVAVLPDGRGFVWHQINACGEVVFDGQPAPEGCPPKPGS